VLQIVERLVKPRRHQETAPRRQLAGKELEHRRLRLAAIQISLDHVHLVEIGEQRTGQWIHRQ